MELKHGFISADDHVYEHAEVWTARMSRQKWGDAIPHIQERPDGTRQWFAGGRALPLPDAASTDGASQAARISEPASPALTDARERLKAMDRDGIDYSVLYPFV